MSKSIIKIHNALEVLELPVLISLKDLKKQYKYLAKVNHPDRIGENEYMQRINEAYELLYNYIINYKFTFNEEEIQKQYPQESHAARFKF